MFLLIGSIIRRCFAVCGSVPKISTWFGCKSSSPGWLLLHLFLWIDKFYCIVKFFTASPCARVGSLFAFLMKFSCIPKVEPYMLNGISSNTLSPCKTRWSVGLSVQKLLCVCDLPIKNRQRNRKKKHLFRKISAC